MSQVLCIIANPRPTEQSFSLRVADAFFEEYRDVAPEDRITHLDVYRDDIPLLDGDVLDCWDHQEGGCPVGELSGRGQRIMNRIDELVEQFMAADKYIFVSPLWNLSIPPMLKAYFDAICIPGKTVKYTSDGPEGLLEGKNALHIQARGGIYSDSPMGDYEFGDSYLRAILGLMGVREVETLVVEGMLQHPQRAEQYLAEAKSRTRLAAEMLARGGTVRPGGRSVERPGMHIHP